MKDSSRPLSTLQTYQGALTPRLLETFLASSPEGVFHMPLAPSPLEPLDPEKALAILERIVPPGGQVWLDLSGADHRDRLFWLEASHRALAISSCDPLCLAVARKAATGLKNHLGGSGHLLWALNQTHPQQPAPRDLNSLPSREKTVCALPHGGPDLGILLREGGDLPHSLSKAVSTLVDNSLDEKNPWRAPLRRPAILAECAEEPVGTPKNEPRLPKADEGRLALANELHQKLLAAFRGKGVLTGGQELGALGRDDLGPQAREILEELLSEITHIDREERQALREETLQLAFGLGPLEPYLRDETVTEIMVNGAERVYIERDGALERVSARFLDEGQLRTILERILAPIGRRVDESQPYVDGRLGDGSRVNAVIPPLSLNGAVLTIRKFPVKNLTVEDLVRFGSLTEEAAAFLGRCVGSRKNLVVSGGTGSGKTTLLNVLSSFIPPTERIVTIEDSAELRLSQDHVVRLEGRPANLEGKGRVTIRDLVANALRMRPDRIVVGEVRGGEALDMLQAMNTGHDGSLTTCHANTPRDAVSRLETMCLMAGLDLPLRAVREQVVRAVDLIVQQSRLRDGKRAVTHIAEVMGMEGDTPVLQDLFRWDEAEGVLKRLPFRASFETGNSIPC